jgi:hypothetical protein
MTLLFSTLAFALGLLLYGGASLLFYLEVAQQRSPKAPPRDLASARKSSLDVRHAPTLLALGALGHAGYVTLASFVARCALSAPYTSSFRSRRSSPSPSTCPRAAASASSRSASSSRRSASSFVMGTFFLGRPDPEPRASPMFLALHVLSNLVGVALFLLAGGAAVLYLVQDNRLKAKRLPMNRSFGALETLDLAIHRFLIAAFPMVTLGIVTGTYWARKLESGSPDEIMRTVFGYATWFFIAGVLLLRATAGWRGRRAAYGTIGGSRVRSWSS